MGTQVATDSRRWLQAIVASAALAILIYAAWLSLDGGRRTPLFETPNGLTLSSQDLRRAHSFDGIELTAPFFYLIPEFRQLQDHQSYLNTHRQVWEQLQRGGPHELTIDGQPIAVATRLPSTEVVFAKYGAVLVVAALFAIGAAIALFRYQSRSGRAAALFLFGASLYGLSLPTLVTRSLTLPFPTLVQTLDLYMIGTCALIGLIYFPFVFNAADLKPWVRQAVFWFLLLTITLLLVGYFRGTMAIASSMWFTLACVALFTGRVIARCWSQLGERNITHTALCYAAVALPTFTFSAFLSWPELLAAEISGLQYFVLTSTVVPIAMISLLESELLQRRNDAQALQLAEQQTISERRAQQARQTVVMNLHDHVARSLDSISALALRAQLAGSNEDHLIRIRELATHAHRALRGLFNVSGETCDTWPELRIQLREYGNTLVESGDVEFQLHDWAIDDSELELGASIKLICFHVLSEAITNAVKYSNASVIHAELGAQENTFTLTVRDSGTGFDPKQVDESRHHGLSIMRKRARLIDGAISVASEPGQGTRITLTGPLVPSSEWGVVTTPLREPATTNGD